MWLDDILNRLTDKEQATFRSNKPWTWGCRQQRLRLEAVARYCAFNWPGDFAEIGCYTGGGTRMLAERARAHNDRRVIAIDPWGAETQGGEKEYATFLKTMEPYRDILDVIRLRSQSFAAKAALKRRELCFALVDGSHLYEDALSDIKAVSHAWVVAVDDVLWNENLTRALEEGARATNKQIVRHTLCREAYLLRMGGIPR